MVLTFRVNKSFNTQPPEGGWRRKGRRKFYRRRFNTQPPEGGWRRKGRRKFYRRRFNTQPPEGGWEEISVLIEQVASVSTHSRPKAAGGYIAHV